MASDGLTIPKSALRTVGVVVAGLIVLIVIVALVLAAYRAFAGSALPSVVDSKTYQAVFLNNGQVYFGKLSAGDANTYYLRHVYFLQSSVTSKGKPGAEQLIKLTKEIHGPEDLMVINRDQVLFVENLNPSGRAAKLIGSGG
jgi:hypothetical protein